LEIRWHQRSRLLKLAVNIQRKGSLREALDMPAPLLGETENVVVIYGIIVSMKNGKVNDWPGKKVEIDVPDGTIGQLTRD
jgi:hypothetical protein